MSNSNRMIKSIIIYFIGSVLSKAIIFFMLPIYTKYIPVSDMGTYDSTWAIVILICTVVFMDLGVGVMRFTLDTDNPLDKNTVINSGLAVFACSCLAYILLAVILSFIFNIKYLQWIVIYGFSYSLNNLYAYMARGKNKNILYMFSGIIATIVDVSCNLFFILYLKWDYKALFISQIISNIVGVIFLECGTKVIKNIKKIHFNKDMFKILLKFSFPLCVNAIAYWFLKSANKIIVTYVLGSEYNGYLAVANKFSSLLFLISSCINLAWQELTAVVDNSLNETTGIFYANAFNIYIKLLSLGLILLIPLIKIGLYIYPAFIDSSYDISINLIPLALTGAVLSVLCGLLGSVFSGIKKTKVVFYSAISGAIVNIAVIFSLIYSIGVNAANIAFICGFLVCIYVRLFILKKYIKMKPNYKQLFLLIPMLIIVIFIFNKEIIYNILILIAFLICSLIYLKKEIRYFISIIKTALVKKNIEETNEKN